ncbi:MAG: 6,7-dimethyl-8-ribityllumazine synthase [Ignavibacteriaceae bacterium]|nr:6,7-dimethyl-8-ribityllumazine synthase [Ignavibacteriaceae bacterium]
MNIIEGNFSCADYKFAIILSRFNEVIGKKLLTGAIECLKTAGCEDKNIDIVKVPGAFEIPLAAAKLIELKKYNAIICLGAVIKGETPHFDYVSDAVSSGIQKVSLKYNVPIAFGVLTTNNLEQALERAGELNNLTLEYSGKQLGNKGWDAALTAIEMANLMTKF